MRICRNCRAETPRSEWIALWCADCVRAFLKGAFAAAGAVVLKWWFL